MLLEKNVAKNGVHGYKIMVRHFEIIIRSNILLRSSWCSFVEKPTAVAGSHAVLI